MENGKTMNLDLVYTQSWVGSPFWTFAIHDGHQIDERLLPFMQLDTSDRLREEDPFTALIAEIPTNRFVVGTSRFQLDINRKKDDAIYLRRDQAWGLDVWDSLPDMYIHALHRSYDRIYTLIDTMIEKTIDRFGYFVVYDVHSYNARREGPDTPIDTLINPEINMGTVFNGDRWHDLTLQLIENMRSLKQDRTYDVRENVKFKGGYLSQYINRKYADKGCVFSIEFRKDFMDEWTGSPYPARIGECRQLLFQTIPLLEQYFAYERRQ